MAMTDDRLSQQVHDAYEKIELSDEAQDRMLAALLDASNTTQRESHSGGTRGRRGASGRVTQAPVRHGLRRWMPLAAALVAALVVVQVGVLAIGGKGTEPHSLAVIGPEDSAATETLEGIPNEEAADSVVVSEEEMKAESTASEAPSASDVVPAAEEYPVVVLSDGTELTARPEQADPAEITDLVEQAMARSEDGERYASCWVYALNDGGLAVKYDSEETYWLCD